MSAAPREVPPSPAEHYAASGKWLVALAAMLATVMEVLDTTIANVALDHIRGGLAAGVDEATWVLTSYIVSNAIVIPLTGWFGNYFGRKKFFNFSILLFTASSLMCGLAPNLQSLVFFRIVQGAGGGALMPMSQAVLMETFAPEEQGMAMAVWGLGMMLGPVMGPVFGGWITDNYSWRWIFLINVPVGLFASFLVTVILEDPHYIKRKISRIDWWGFVLMALGIGALQIVLDKGERADWFSSPLITTLAAVGVAGLLLFVARELTVKEPVVDLSVFTNRTFAIGTAMTTFVMFGLYGTFVLIPLYCQLAQGYTPLLAGKVLSIQSLGTFGAIMAAGRLFNRVDPRLMVSSGCLMAGIGTWYMGEFNPQIDFWNIAWPGLIRGIGSGMIFIPLTTVALGAVRREQMGNASGLFNMVRSVGGSVGIALLITMLSRNQQTHQSHLVEHLNLFNPRLQSAFALAASGAIPGLGRNHAPVFGMMYGEVQRQALVLSFLDDFRLIAMIFFALVPMVYLMRRPGAAAPATAAH
ncbi:MAG TPA: DHA2 family efflux MFS transporter permease subunit [Candidatus Binataceae bacterium]|jgi:DHA2 family multidrug resistance protein|nr:DHA2 family efflux MFS transporter permease subunit [Candidatus Binataceae bacterium]